MNSNITLNLREKRDFGQVINVTFLFLKLTWKSLLKDLLFIAGPAFLVGGIFTALYQYEGLSGIISSNTLSYTNYIFSLFFFFLGSVLSAIIAGNHIYHYNRTGLDINRQEMWRDVKNDFIKIFFTYVAYFLILAVGFVFLIIPGIYFFIALSLLVIIRILEKDLGLVKAISESFRLIKGNWWRTTGLLIVVTFISYAFSMVFMIPGLVTTFLISFNSLSGSPAEDYRLVHIILVSIGYIAYAMVTAIPLVAFAVYYFSLKEEKDGSGILEQIETIGSQGTFDKEDEGSY